MYADNRAEGVRLHTCKGKACQQLANNAKSIGRAEYEAWHNSVKSLSPDEGKSPPLILEQRVLLRLCEGASQQDD